MASPPHATPQIPIHPVSATESIIHNWETRIRLGDEVTDEQLVQCATFFSENYGKWGPGVRKPLKANARIKMTANFLRTKCLNDPKNTVLIMRYMDGRLVAQAFATKWSSGTEMVGWITQLVVDAGQRKQGVATKMVQELADSSWFTGVTMMGIASSNPVACHVLCNMLHKDVANVNLSYIRENALKVLQGSAVQYLRNAAQAELRGSLFQDVDDGSISLVYTDFYIDHGEPERILNSYIEERGWSLGMLKDGHEFLLILPTA